MLNIIKNKKLWIGILVVCAPLCFILYLLSLMQIIPSYSHGFGVDSSERVYLGLDGHILVYENNVETENFSSQTSRGYHMTVKDDIIYIGTGSRSISMDLAGNVLSDEEDDLSQAMEEIKKYKTCSVNGTEYKMKSVFGRTYITRSTENEEIIIFKEPFPGYILRLCLIVSTVGVIISAICLILTYNRIEHYK